MKRFLVEMPSGGSAGTAVVVVELFGQEFIARGSIEGVRNGVRVPVAPVHHREWRRRGREADEGRARQSSAESDAKREILSAAHQPPRLR